MHRRTDRTTTVTLAAHAHRGLINKCTHVYIYVDYSSKRVHFKMRQFHSRLKSVCVPRCVTKVSMHLSISHSLCSAVHNWGERERAPSCGLNGRAVTIDVRPYVRSPLLRMRGATRKCSRPDRESFQSMLSQHFQPASDRDRVSPAESAFWYHGKCCDDDLGLQMRGRRAFLGLQTRGRRAFPASAR